MRIDYRKSKRDETLREDWIIVTSRHHTILLTQNGLVIPVILSCEYKILIWHSNVEDMMLILIVLELGLLGTGKSYL